MSRNMMVTGILTKTDLAELTGAKQLTKQISMLKEEGVPYFYRAYMDYPRTTWEIVHETLKKQLEAGQKTLSQNQIYAISEDGLKEAKNAKSKSNRKQESTTVCKKAHKRVLPRTESEDT